MSQALDARMKALKSFDVEPSGTGKMDTSTGCVEKLMAAGRTRTEAEEVCGAHKKNVAEGKYRDSLLGKIMSSRGK